MLPGSPAPVLPQPLTLTDSRRLTGPNLFWDRVGAVLEVRVGETDARAALPAWERAARTILDAVGWREEATRIRPFPGGASLVISAPIDALFAATEVNEWALAAANAALTRSPAPDLEEAAERLRELIIAESNPRLLALQHAAESHGVTLLVDESQVSVGSGTGSVVWPLDQLPDPAEVPWPEVHDVPTVLVTGSNGKTTTVRLLAAVLARAGKVPGICCSDTVTVGSEVIARGDWSGPGGARLVLRDRRTAVAVLETARGGMLRRGLAADRADAAIITNVAEDHFGEFGISDLASLAEAKLVVARALGSTGRIVLNASDPELVALQSRIESPLTWFSLDPGNAVLRAHVRAGGEAVTVDGGQVILFRERSAHLVIAVDAIPITLGGAALHNVANALGVVALAAALGLEPAAIAAGLAGFLGTTADNPGRLNRFEFGGITVVVDFAHNPHGMHALVDLARRLPARRRLMLLGQAGDRDDVAVRDFARSAWQFRPDRIVLKEMPDYLRGRAPGEITALLESEFLRLGAAAESIELAESEFAGVRAALSWTRTGDLLLLPIHSERERVLALLETLQNESWQPGRPLPA